MQKKVLGLTTFHIALLISFILFPLLTQARTQNVRAMWVTAWNLTKPQSIDSVFAKAKRNDFNQVFVQVRYRGDAMYIPNKADTSYNNPEKRSYILKSSPFDPLAYCIEKGRLDSIEVHAWVTVFVIAPRNIQKLNKGHLYYVHKDWITNDSKGRKMATDALEGSYVDPAITQMRSYTIQVLSDLVANYNMHGIQLDYIRYPDSTYGYHPEAISNFKSSQSDDFANWKRQQISSFVNLIYIQLKNINPNLQISAAVKADYQDAYYRYSQDWKSWLTGKYIDKVYLMAYTHSTDKLKRQMEANMDVPNKRQVVVGLRAWAEKRPYPAYKINAKIVMLRKLGFKNLAFYSYGGMKQQKYFKHILLN